MEFLEKYFQSRRLQRTSVAHSIRKNEKALRSYGTFLTKSSNSGRNCSTLIPFFGFNVSIHLCIQNKNLNEIFTEGNYYFHINGTGQKIIIPRAVLISLTAHNMLYK